MQNKEKWTPAHFVKDAKGRVVGGHMHKIIGYSYEKAIKENSSGVLLDIGCGSVPYYDIYKDLVQDTICIDWGKEDGEISYLDYIADLNEKIALDSEIADTVLCTDVLEHIRTPEILFSEMARLMRKDAKLILTVPFLYWIHDEPYDNHRYTRYMLEDFCKRNNLTVVSLEEYGGLPEVLYDLVYKGYNFYGFPLRRAFLFFWRKLGMFLHRRKKVKEWSMQSRKTFPLGYILIAQKK